MLCFLAFILVFILSFLVLAFTVEKQYKCAITCLLLLPGVIICGLSSYQVSKDELQAKPFKYYPTAVLVENGNRYISTGTSKIIPKFTIPEGRQIVYLKHRATDNWCVPLEERFYVLNEGD